MGVVLTNGNKEVHIGYIGFGFIRKAIAHSFNEEIGNLYDKLYIGYKYTDEDNKYLDENLPKYLDEFLYHSDCDGCIEVESVKGIYETKAEAQFYEYLEEHTTEQQKRIDKVIEFIEPFVEIDMCTIKGTMLRKPLAILKGETNE